MGKVTISGGRVDMKKPVSLPSGYTKLAYIQSNGTQYINTGIVPTANTRFIVDFQLTAPSTANEAIVSTVQFSFRYYGTNSCFRSNNSNQVDFSTAINAAARHTAEKTATGCTIDNTYTVANTAGSTTYPLFICAHNASGTASNFANVKIYSVKIYENEEQVRNLIPCMNENGIVGLCDIINNQFYGSETNSAFNGYLEGEGEVLQACTITLTNDGSSGRCFLTIGGSTVYEAGTYELLSGSTIVCNVAGIIEKSSRIISINGVEVVNTSGTSVYSYNYTVVKDATISFSYSTGSSTIAIMEVE